MGRLLGTVVPTLKDVADTASGARGEHPAGRTPVLGLLTIANKLTTVAEVVNPILTIRIVALGVVGLF